MQAKTDVLRATEDQLLSERGKTGVRPRVLVLLATYNGEQWIDEQLRSILNQESVDVQIVIRDDCSTDATLEVAQHLVNERVSTTKATTPSGSASQNFFALIREHSAAGFDFVAFSDQDDLWNPNKLSRACQQLTATSSAGYSSSVLAFWNDGEERVLCQSRKSTDFDFLFEGAGQGCTFVLRRDFYDRARTFMRSNKVLTRGLQFHDWGIYALARCWGLQWIFDPMPTMRYRQHQGNAIGAKKSLVGIRRRITLIRSGWYKEQLVAVANLCTIAAPNAEDLRNWQELLLAPDRWRRRIRLARFSMMNGRRNKIERLFVLVSIVRGWI